MDETREELLRGMINNMPAPLWTRIGDIDLSTRETKAGEEMSLQVDYAKRHGILRATLFKNGHYWDEMQLDLSRTLEEL